MPTLSYRFSGGKMFCKVVAVLGGVVVEDTDFDKALDALEGEANKYPNGLVYILDCERSKEYRLEKYDREKVKTICGQNPKALRLSILAYHIGEIMRTEAPAKLSLHPVTGVAADIEIEQRRDLTEDRIWDQVKVNGRHCGNRAGGVQEFVKLVCQLGPDISYT